MNKLTKSLSALVIAACALPIVGCAADSGDGAIDSEEAHTENTIVVADGPDETSEERETPEVQDDPSAVHTLGRAPSCIERRTEAVRTLHVANGCRTEKWLKVIISKARDSDCFRIVPGEVVHVSWNWPGGYDGLVTC